MELILTESDVSLDPVSPSATDLSTDLDCVPDTDPRSSDVYAVPEDVTDAHNLEVPHHIQEMAEMADELAVDPFLDAEEYIQQFSPEINPERADEDLAEVEEDNMEEDIIAEDTSQNNQFLH